MSLKDNNRSSKLPRSSSNSLGFSIGHHIPNRHHSFVVKKSERLASALYVITGFISVEDPIRNRLRVSSLDLIARASDPRELHGQGVHTFKARCVEIAAVLETAHSGGLVSSMNAEVIAKEYAALASFVSENESLILEGLGAVEEALSTPTQPPISKGHKSHLENKTKNIANLEGGKSEKSDRASLIMNVLDKKGKVSIKDISSSIDGYSEKTIQRDLTVLTQAGLVVKEGSRRWSTYRRADSAAPLQS